MFGMNKSQKINRERLERRLKNLKQRQSRLSKKEVKVDTAYKLRKLKSEITMVQRTLGK